MPKEIFDQNRPRSTMARRLDEAFAGCDQWTLAPPTPRRGEAELSQPLTSPARIYDEAGLRPQGPGAF
jgi:hypothetical protein